MAYLAVIECACHVGCTKRNALRCKLQQGISKIEAIAYRPGVKICHELIVWLWTFDAATDTHFDPDGDSDTHHCYLQKVFGYNNTSVTRLKTAPHSLLVAFKVLICFTYWIVPRKRTEWVIRLWRPLRWALNFESVTMEQILLGILCRKALGDKVIYF